MSLLDGRDMEERFLFHRAHIHQDDMEMFQEYSDKLSVERRDRLPLYSSDKWRNVCPLQWKKRL